MGDAWEAWLTGGLMVAMFATLVVGRFGPDIILMGVLLVLLVTGVLEPEAAIAGFANPGVATVAMLYIVAAAMKETGATNMLTSRILGRPKTLREAQLRLALPVAGLSAFINNTPIVAMFLPTLSGMARRCQLPASKLFMPLSFASILGGVCTLIGTSTNVIIAGLLIANADKIGRDADGEPLVEFGMFTLAKVGLPIAVLGIIYILIFGRRLLPDRRAPGENEDNGERREYYSAMRVGSSSPIVGKTVEQAGLRALPGLFLSRIERDHETIVAVAPDHDIAAGDVLVFVGALESVMDLQQFKGLTPVTADEDAGVYRPNLKLIEAVVSTTSALVGQTIRESEIRTRYGAVVIAVHRQGQQLTGKIGEIRLRAGDTLLMEAPRGFASRFGESKGFYLVSERSDSAALRHDRAWMALGILAALVVTITMGWLTPMVAAMAAAGAMVLFRCCTGPQARAGVDWQVLVVIGAAFGIGRAMEQTGLAGEIAHFFVDFAGSGHPWALLAVVYGLTLAFTMCMTNNAAAVLMFPIALSVTREAGLNFFPFAVAVTIAASCEFSTPIGYQTNLMVMGPGGYKWTDYTKFGLPLTLLAAAVCIGLAPLMFGGF